VGRLLNKLKSLHICIEGVFISSNVAAIFHCRPVSLLKLDLKCIIWPIIHGLPEENNSNFAMLLNDQRFRCNPIDFLLKIRHFTSVGRRSRADDSRKFLRKVRPLVNSFYEYFVMPLTPLALSNRAIGMRAIAVACTALLGILPSGAASAHGTEIFVRTEPAQNESGTHGDAAAQAGSVLVVTVPDESHVSLSRAADLVGRPVSFLRPFHKDQSGAELSGPTPYSPALLPSRMPVAAYRLTSSFGLRQHPLLGGLREHSGVDLAAPMGSPIYATSDGVVGAASWRGGYGLSVSLEHGGGVETRYGHLSRLNVAAGQQVRKGDIIGLVGSTGLSTGPHLHYEVRLNGRAVDPAPYLKPR
jgi:murein DD-endopeptidase MepM/ murein hydrolase activator NlpD